MRVGLESAQNPTEHGSHDLLLLVIKLVITYRARAHLLSKGFSA